MAVIHLWITRITERGFSSKIKQTNHDQPKWNGQQKLCVQWQWRHTQATECDDEKWKDDPRDHLEFVKRSGATVLGHDECVQSVLDLRLAVKAAVGIHVQRGHF